MWNNADELVVASSGQVYVAPADTPLPTTPTGALNAAFVGTGYISEDGATFSRNPEITNFGAWQSRNPILRKLTGVECMVSFALQQWNEETVPLAFGGGEITPVSGGFRYDPPGDSDSLDERVMVIDAVDGATHHRWVLERGTVTEAVETQLQRTATALLPISFAVLAPDGGGEGWYYLTDSDAFVAGS